MNFPAALTHGDIKEVFDNVFMVTGTMRNEFFGSPWQFSRNMIIVRDDNCLTLINSVRLNDTGLKELDSLGKVGNLVRLGDMHGIDDPFYIDRYSAPSTYSNTINYWTLPKMGTVKVPTSTPSTYKTLKTDGEMPFHDCSLFIFETTKRPECILRLNRDGGIMIACDALQNWEEPDEFFDAETIIKMKSMDFFTHAGVGPAWIQGSEPKAEDFERLNKVSFNHALCGHGTPVKDTAQADFASTFQRIFGTSV